MGRNSCKPSIHDLFLMVGVASTITRYKETFTMSDLAKRVKWSRNKVYAVLQRMLDLGLCAYVPSNALDKKRRSRKEKAMYLTYDAINALHKYVETIRLVKVDFWEEVNKVSTSRSRGYVRSPK